jgi:type VI protein secretion system component Hcp
MSNHDSQIFKSMDHNYFVDTQSRTKVFLSGKVKGGDKIEDPDVKVANVEKCVECYLFTMHTIKEFQRDTGTFTVPVDNGISFGIPLINKAVPALKQALFLGSEVEELAFKHCHYTEDGEIKIFSITTLKKSRLSEVYIDHYMKPLPTAYFVVMAAEYEFENKIHNTSFKYNWTKQKKG